MIDKTAAGGSGEEFGLEADQAARRYHILQSHPALTVGLHVQQVALARAELFHDATLVLAFHVHGQQLIRLVLLAADFFNNDLRARYAEFIALAPHVLYQYAQVQLAAAGDAELVGAAGIFHAQRHVGDELALQALAYLAAGDVLAILAGERRIVHLERHGDRGLIHR